jgi:outer membrane protein assembly factor BamB
MPDLHDALDAAPHGVRGIHGESALRAARERGRPWAALVALLACGGCHAGGEQATSRPPLGDSTDAQSPPGEPPDAQPPPGGLPDAQPPLGDGGVAMPDAAPMVPTTSAVLTYHNDNARSGTQLRETILTPMTVQTHGMRLLATHHVDGSMLAQVLYVPQLDGEHDVIFAATIKNSVYAHDANDASLNDSGRLWRTHLVDPEDSSRTYARGIISTPTIDLGARELYAVFSTSDTQTEPNGESTSNTAFWLVALDLDTGAVKRTAKMAGSVPRADGSRLDFLARNHLNRPGLLLSRGVIYASFGTRAKETQVMYHGWVLAWDQTTFAPRGAYCVTPNSNQPGNGGGIWMGCGAPAADAAGGVYLITGNADRRPEAGWYGNSFLKLTQSGDALAVAGSWGPNDPFNHLQINDVDLGAGSALILPGTRRIVGGGKTGTIYVLDADTMGEVQEFQGFLNVYDPDFVLDSNWEGGPHLHGGPLAWQGPDPNIIYFYAWSENDHLKAYLYDRRSDHFNPAGPLVGAPLAIQEIMPGGMLTLSAAGTSGGIVWASLPRDTNLNGRLFAFDAQSLALLWQTDYPTLAKWMPPTVADGKVIVPTGANEILVYTLAP